VAEEAHVVEGERGLLAALLQAVDDALFGRARRRRRLGHVDVAVSDGDDVRERAADVDADPYVVRAHGSCPVVVCPATRLLTGVRLQT